MYGMIFLVVGVPDDPVLELRDPGVDAGPVAVAAADAPADDAGELVAAVPPLDDHGAARVALARVLAAVGGARAHEDPRDPLVLTRAPVHRHALRVGDENLIGFCEESRRDGKTIPPM